MGLSTKALASIEVSGSMCVIPIGVLVPLIIRYRGKYPAAAMGSKIVESKTVLDWNGSKGFEKQIIVALSSATTSVKEPGGNPLSDVSANRTTADETVEVG